MMTVGWPIRRGCSWCANTWGGGNAHLPELPIRPRFNPARVPSLGQAHDHLTATQIPGVQAGPALVPPEGAQTRDLECEVLPDIVLQLPDVHAVVHGPSLSSLDGDAVDPMLGDRRREWRSRGPPPAPPSRPAARTMVPRSRQRTSGIRTSANLG